jgi:hypothetical protein
MSMPFTFDFLPPNEATEESSLSTSAQEASRPQDMQVDDVSFTWLQNLEPEFHASLEQEPPNDVIPISETSHTNCLRRVRVSEKSSQSFRNTDLVPGLYEGGLKVWECSIDLCRWLQDNNFVVEGSVLELGCGHGLPGCWVLQQARSRPNSTATVVFSDFNEFVLRDATIANIALNARSATNDVGDTKELASWLSQHALLGAGDWNIMSQQLSQSSENLPSVAPRDGMFDCILAAETTYSEATGKDTALLLAKHLKVDTGVAFIASKRYYFGVGGGTDSFREALAGLSSFGQFHVDTLKVYDNGAGNIRELLQVKRLSR